MSQNNPNVIPQKEDPKQDLGQKLDHFPIRRRGLKRWSAASVGVVLIFSSVLFTLIHSINTWQNIQIHGRAVLLSRLPTILTLLGLILPLGVLTFVFAVVHWHDGVDRYDKGLFRKAGFREGVWLWEETEGLDTQITKVKFGGSTIGLKINVLLKNGKDQRWTIKNRYDRMDELITQIRLNVLPLLVKKAQRRLLRDETISFKKNLQASYQGLEIMGELKPWEDIEKALIENGQLKLYDKSNQKLLFKSDVQKIKHLDLLLHFLQKPPNQGG